MRWFGLVFQERDYVAEKRNPMFNWILKGKWNQLCFWLNLHAWCNLAVCHTPVEILSGLSGLHDPLIRFSWVSLSTWINQLTKYSNPPELFFKCLLSYRGYFWLSNGRSSLIHWPTIMSTMVLLIIVPINLCKPKVGKIWNQKMLFSPILTKLHFIHK